MSEPQSGPLRQINMDHMQAFLGRASEGPVVMLNLLKFLPDDGEESHMQYSAAVAPLLAKVQGRVVYAGRPMEMLIGNEDWDLMAIIEYPTRQGLIDMTTSDEYRAIEHLRHDALERSVLYSMDPVDL